MNEVKNALKRMAFYYLLLAINILPNANIIPDNFPTRNFSEIYLLLLCVCLVLYYSHRIVKAGMLSFMMKSLSWMALLLILLRGIKYSAFSQVGTLARHTWYLYYVPMLLLPLFFFYISLLVSPKGNAHFPKKWLWTLALTVVLIILVLSNDLHQLVFIFKPNFYNWDVDYSHGWLFYAVTAWQFVLYFSAIIILIIKCRISSAKRNAWIILIPFTTGIVLIALLLSGKMPRINGAHFIEFPETLIFTIAIVLECCIQLGLIPTNTDYAKLFEKFSIAAQITDENGQSVYSSYLAKPLNQKQFALPDGARIGEHTVLHKMKIPGGFGFWQDDMTELDRLNGELAEAKENLAQETELIRLRNELKEKETKTRQRTLVYDTIAKRTQAQSQAISLLAEKARLSDDIALKHSYKFKITLLGAYIKRYANLMLLSQENSEIEAGELALSVSEVLHYLNFCAVPGECINSADCTVNADSALEVFEAFETLIETNYSSMKGVFVNISEQECVVFKLTIENFKEELSSDMAERLSERGVLVDCSQEDGVYYVCFTLPKGGAKV